MKPVDHILANIAAFRPEEGEWLTLENHLEALWETGEAHKGIATLFGVFERYPEEDGDGVLWSIVHGLEHLGSYEQELIASLQRQPSEMGVIMLKRIENSGTNLIGGQPITLVYHQITQHPKVPQSVLEQVV